MSKNNHRGAAAQGPYVAVGGDFTGSSVGDAAMVVGAVVAHHHAEAPARAERAALVPVDAPVLDVAPGVLAIAARSEPPPVPQPGSKGAPLLRGDVARLNRYDLRRSVQAYVCLSPAVCSCGEPRDGEVTFRRAKRPGDKHHSQAVFGLTTCGSSTLCRVCAAKIRAAWGEELIRAIAEARRQGMGVYTAVLTVPHEYFEACAVVMDRVKEVFRDVFTKGAPAKRFKARHEIAGFFHAEDYTHGSIHGHHPHRNLVVFTERELSPAELATLNTDYAERLTKAFRDRNLRPPPPPDKHGRRGGDFVPLDSDAATARYMVGSTLPKGTSGDARAALRRTASEVLRLDVKRARGETDGRTPFELQDEALRLLQEAYGDESVVEASLWREYELAVRGRKQKGWSEGLKARLGIVEKKDDEIVKEADVEGPTVEEWRVPADVYRAAVLAQPGRDGALRLAWRDGGQAAAEALLLAWIASDGARGAPRGAPFGAVVGEA